MRHESQEVATLPRSSRICHNGPAGGDNEFCSDRFRDRELPAQQRLRHRSRESGGGEIVEQAFHLIRPPTREFVFTHIHGLTWNDVAKSDDFGKLWPRLAPMLEGATFLAAHNASFDKGVLNACCGSYGIEAPSLPFRCTVQMSRRAWNIRPTKLSDVCAKLGIALNHHEALSDALACARIVLAANEVTVGD